METLTKRQRQVLEIIINFIKENEYPPTLRELADALGASSRNSAVKHLQTLHKKGYIVWQEKKARGIKVVHYLGMKDDDENYTLPLVGAVIAGQPGLTRENIEKYITVPKNMIRNSQVHFLLRVHGESMKNAGILNNDLVLVRKHDSAEIGSIVVACIQNERIVKRLCKRDDGVKYLSSENPLYPDIFLEGDWTIEGKVVSLIRETIV